MAMTVEGIERKRMSKMQIMSFMIGFESVVQGEVPALRLLWLLQCCGLQRSGVTA